MYELGLPSFMSNTLEDLNIGTYHDIATVRYYYGRPPAMLAADHSVLQL